MLVTEGGMGLLWYSARQFGNFELQVDWRVTKKSDNSGIFVRFPAPTSKQPGEWNTFLIRVEGQIYNVTLNGEPVAINFKGNRSMRGHIGLQNHSPEDQVFFRNIIATPF